MILLLTECWLHNAADLTDLVSLRFLDESETYATPVSQRRYAGGRLRMVSRPGRNTQIEIGCVKMTRADYIELKRRIGTLQLMRLPRGRKLYGFIADLQVTERRAYDALDTTFTFTEVTSIEAV